MTVYERKSKYFASVSIRGYVTNVFTLDIELTL